MIIEIILIGILLLFSAFFSSSETALLSINKAKIRSIKNKKIRRTVEELIKDKNYVLTGILIGNNLVNIAISSITTILIANLLEMFHLDESFSLILTLLIVTPLILIFGEIIPKNVAALKPLDLIKILAVPLKYSLLLLSPLIKIFDFIVKIINKIFNIKESKIDKEEIKNTIEVSVEEGVISKDEVKIIHNALDLGEKKLVDILMPINKVVYLTEDKKIKDLLELVKKYKFSRYPIFDKEKSKILGFVHVRDILNENPEEPVSRYMRKIIYLDEDLDAKTAFEVLRRNKTHIACVVNKYGVPVGIVTLEDIIEEVFGEIYDEGDENENKGNI